MQQWISPRSSCYCEWAAQDAWAVVCNAEEKFLSLTLPNFCLHLSHWPSPTPILTCGRNTKISSVMACSPLSLGRSPPNLQLPMYIFIPNMVSVWFRFMVLVNVGGRRGRGSGGCQCGLLCCWFIPAPCPFCTLNSNASSPRANVSSFLAPPTQFQPNQWPQCPSVPSSDASLDPLPHSSRKTLLYILGVRVMKSGKASWRKLHISWDLKDRCDFHREGW